MTAITDESLEPGMWNLVWRCAMNIPTHCVQDIECSNNYTRQQGNRLSLYISKTRKFTYLLQTQHITDYIHHILLQLSFHDNLG
jgi:hypothetical protein